MKIVKKFADVEIIHCAIIKMEVVDVMKDGPEISNINQFISHQQIKYIFLPVATFHVHPDLME